jgi:hypothetical protein
VNMCQDLQEGASGRPRTPFEDNHSGKMSVYGYGPGTKQWLSVWKSLSPPYPQRHDKLAQL